MSACTFNLSSVFVIEIPPSRAESENILGKIQISTDEFLIFKYHALLFSSEHWITKTWIYLYQSSAGCGWCLTSCAMVFLKAEVVSPLASSMHISSKCCQYSNGKGWRNILFSRCFEKNRETSYFHVVSKRIVRLGLSKIVISPFQYFSFFL